jgi:hypothetical protein
VEKGHVGGLTEVIHSAPPQVVVVPGSELSPDLDPTVRHPTEEQGIRGAEMVRALLRGEVDVATESTLPTELVIRGSTAPSRTVGRVGQGVTPPLAPMF